MEVLNVVSVVVSVSVRFYSFKAERDKSMELNYLPVGRVYVTKICVPVY